MDHELLEHIENEYDEVNEGLIDLDPDKTIAIDVEVPNGMHEDLDKRQFQFDMGQVQEVSKLIKFVADHIPDKFINEGEHDTSRISMTEDMFLDLYDNDEENKYIFDVRLWDTKGEASVSLAQMTLDRDYVNDPDGFFEGIEKYYNIDKPTDSYLVGVVDDMFANQVLKIIENIEKNRGQT